MSCSKKYKIKFKLIKDEVEIDFNDYFPDAEFDEEFINKIIRNEIAPNEVHISYEITKL